MVKREIANLRKRGAKALRKLCACWCYSRALKKLRQV